MTTRTREDTPATIAAALALWSGGTAVAAAAGAFAKFSPAFVLALAAFAFAFALATAYLDAGVRATIDAMPPTTLFLAAATVLALSAAALYAFAGTARALDNVPFLLAALFGAPAGGALAVAALHRAVRSRAVPVRSARRLTSALG